MHCNNNLTDDQLEDMFTATNKVMRHIEQQMERLIERTKHKYKMCNQIFL